MVVVVVIANLARDGVSATASGQHPNINVLAVISGGLETGDCFCMQVSEHVVCCWFYGWNANMVATQDVNPPISIYIYTHYMCV